MHLTGQQICQLKDVITYSSAILALLAAGFWGRATYWGWFDFVHTNLDQIQRYMARQARCNALAAACAALAALMQLSLSWFPVCRAFA
jgi:hypothetical protein